MAKGFKTGGRKPGSQNKINKDIREAIAQAFEQAGGVEYLVSQSRENPQAFMTLIGKIIPAEVKAQIDGQFVIKVVGRAGNNATP